VEPCINVQAIMELYESFVKGDNFLAGHASYGILRYVVLSLSLLLFLCDVSMAFSSSYAFAAVAMRSTTRVLNEHIRRLPFYCVCSLWVYSAQQSRRWGFNGRVSVMTLSSPVLE